MTSSERGQLARRRVRRRSRSGSVSVVALLVVSALTSVGSAYASNAGRSSTTSTTSSTSSTSTTSTAPTTSTTVRSPVYGVGVERCTFVDTSRTVPNYATPHPTVLDRRRTLVTEIRYPTNTGPVVAREIPGAPPAPSANGYATIVFASGYDVVPDDYRALLDAWVRRGFVVAAPIFPDTNPTAVEAQPRTDTERDLHNQAADLTFVTRQLLNDSASSSQTCPVVKGLIRRSALALAGQSDGADTVAQLAYSTGRDPQKVPYRQLRAGLSYLAAIVMSGGEMGKAKYRSLVTSPPVLVIQSARDRCNAPIGALKLYRDIDAHDKWFLELMTAHHFPPFSGTDKSAFTSVVSVTSHFLQWKLLGADSPTTLARAGSARPAVARIFHDGPGPTIAPLDLPAICGTT